jgi:diguanylate cyclase (GGDEF)-like protein/excisionase family DNA binding protein
MALAIRRDDGADLLTIGEAAAVAGVHRETVRAWCAGGRLACVRSPGGRTLVSRDALERHLLAGAGRRREADGRATRPAAALPRAVTPGTTPAAHTGTAILSRIAAAPADAGSLGRVLEGVLRSAVEFFGAGQAALWRHDPDRARPLRLLSRHGLTGGSIDRLRDTLQDGPDALLPRILAGELVVLDSVCYCPITFRQEVIGALAIVGSPGRAWRPEELSLVRSFADGIAVAMGNARLLDAVRDLARRLDAVQELASRLSSIQDVAAIGEAIIVEARRLLTFDSIRVYRVDHDRRRCDPIAWAGTFPGLPQPTPEDLAVAIGEGLTGWVAQTGASILVGDASRDPRVVFIGDEGDTPEPESIVAVPMLEGGLVRGLIVVSRMGVGRFGEDDRTTLAIFAGAAAQALANAERLDQLRQQRGELEFQLASQRRLLTVNEQLLSTLEPAGVLDLIADSLKTVVSYDALTIYRLDRERNLRRAVVARDRFAELILQHEAPADTGITGWAVAHRAAVLANDALNDPRASQIPGTSDDPQSLAVVPLIAEGEVLGTLNLTRIGPPDVAAFAENEFELIQLFAAQAAIALHNAETHHRIRTQAERDALTGLRNHGSFQRDLETAVERAGDKPIAVLMMDLDRFKAFNDRNGHPAGDQLLASVARAVESSVRHGDLVYRYGGDEFAVILEDIGAARADEVRARIVAAVDLVAESAGAPRVGVSVGVASYPRDAVSKPALIEAADAALFLAKDDPFRTRTASAVTAALDATASAILESTEEQHFFDTLLARSGKLLGTPHAYLGLLEADERHFDLRAGVGMFREKVGSRIAVDRGVAGEVYRTGTAFGVDDYTTFERRLNEYDGTIGSVMGVPLLSRGRVIGVIGAATEPGGPSFTREGIEAVRRFARLASVAAANLRLEEQAAAGHDQDAITGLPVRDVLLRRMVELLADGATDATSRLAVLRLEVDRFRVLVESLGHATGDRIIRDVADRLRAVTGPDALVSPFGRGEFGVLLAGADRDAGVDLARRIQSELKLPFEIDGRAWFLSACIGVSATSGEAVTADELLREAEIALDVAQREATSRIAAYDAVRDRSARERVDLEAELRLALDRNELLVHYQPIVDLRTGDLSGLEALARWRHPVRGLVPPMDFISVAEQSDLIVSLGRVVLDEICRQAREWLDRRPDRPLPISVNLSAREFAQPDLPMALDDLMATHGVPPQLIQLEITESTVMDRSEAGVQTLRTLRDRGFRLMLDDFGTGFSSLSQLRDLPLDGIKIDRSFVTELGPGDPNDAIVRAIVTLAHGLGVKVVAEGIEVPGQARRLRALGCDLGQGFLWSRPLEPAAIDDLLAADEAQRRSPKSRSSARKRLTKSR